MQITRQHLIDWSACAGGRDWFDANYPSGEGEYVNVLLALHRDGYRDYSNWLSWRVINHLPDACVAECAFGDALIEQMATEADHNEDTAARLSASGYAARLSASGNDARLSASGTAASLSASGYAASLSASGNDASLSASGNDAAIASAGMRSTFCLGENGCAAIAYHDGLRIRFAVAYVGENVEANKTYRVNDSGEFVEVQL